MTRYLMVVVALAGLETAVRAGGPPPVYVVVDKVVLEPSADAPERIRIEGSFVRLENVERYEYGKPVQGYVYLGLEAGKEAASRAEWAKWQKAAGNGKVVAVGSCHDAGTFLTVKVRSPGERVDKPDAAYSTGEAGIAPIRVEGYWAQQSAIRDLLAFDKARQQAAKP